MGWSIEHTRSVLRALLLLFLSLRHMTAHSVSALMASLALGKSWMKVYFKLFNMLGRVVVGKRVNTIKPAEASILFHTLPNPAAKQGLIDYAISIRKKYCFCLMWYTCMNASVNRELSVSSIIVPSRVGISQSQKMSLKTLSLAHYPQCH